MDAINEITNNQINYSHSQTSFNHLPKFTTANKLLVNDKFCIKYGTKKKKRIIEITLGDKICIVKPHTDLVCDTIVRGILSKRHKELVSPRDTYTLYVFIFLISIIIFFTIVSKCIRSWGSINSIIWYYPSAATITNTEISYNNIVKIIIDILTLYFAYSDTTISIFRFVFIIISIWIGILFIRWVF